MARIFPAGPARLWLVFAVALLVRLAYGTWAIPFDAQKHADDDFYTSSDGYVFLAQTLATHGKAAFSPDEPPTAFRSPAYPLMLVPFLKLTGNVAVAVLIVNATISAAACAALAAFAWRFLGPQTWLAPWAAVFLPISVWYTARSFSDAALSGAYGLFVVAAAYLLERGTFRLGLATGLAHGLALLVKTIVLPFAFLLPLLAAVFHRRATPATLAACAVTLALLSLLLARNYAVTGRVGLSGGFGYNLLLGCFAPRITGNPDAVTKKAFAEAAKEYEKATGKPLTIRDVRPVHFFDIPPALDDELRRLALQKIAADPLNYLRNLPVQAYRFWCASNDRRNQAVSALMHFPIAGLGLIGIIRLWRSKPMIACWWAAASFGVFLLYTLTWVQTVRYALPVLLLLAPLAGWSIEWLFERMPGQRQSVVVSRSSVRE